ncbi:hypothetical protein PAMA_014492 [Pampus argenteus]
MSVGLEADFYGDEVFSSRFPIHRACRDGDVGALVSLSQQQLSHQAALSAEDSCYGWTPIHWAAHCGQLECVVRLVQMGCEVNTVSSRFNQTPTHTAAFGGHPDCVLWLTQAGADVNRQDFVGEAPIHKAARSGSLECIQVLLIAGAKPQLRNASGQTAADLALAHGFHDCTRIISNAQKHLLQLHSGGQNGNGQALISRAAGRKRLLTATEAAHMKKARRDVLLQMQSSAAELDNMHMESVQLSSGQTDVDSKAVAGGYPDMLPAADQDHSARDRANQQTAAVSAQRASADMCGSLHLTESPSSCASHRPAWWGLAGADCGDFLHYGHYHGFGDTAEELTDSSRLEYSSSIQAEHRYNQAVAGSIHLYHGS